MVSFVKDAFEMFLPPMGAEPAVVQRWRYLIATGMTVLTLATTCLYIITARASDVDELKIAAYIPTIEKLNERYCLASNPETERLLRRQYVEYQRRYAEIVGDQYPVESCEDIRERRGS